jgi:hypothetical protein
MVSDILIFTKSPKADADLKPGDYRALILELVGDLRAEALLKSTQIEMQNAPRLPSCASIRAA